MVNKPPPPRAVEKEDDEGEAKPEIVVTLKRPAKLVALWVVLGIFFTYAFWGLFAALFAHVEDPSKIKLPAFDVPPPVTSQNQPESEAQPEEETAPSDDTATPADLQGEEEPPELFDEGKQGLAPQTLIPWEENPVATIAGPARIAIVIDDMGLNRPNSKRAADMAAQLTLAYLPYADGLQAQADEARAKGHELLVHMPMEPDDIARNNPGPEALLTTNSPEENIARFEKNMRRFEGSIGLNNHMGSRMTADEKAIRPVLEQAKRDGLWFLDSRTIGNSVAGKIAAQLGIPYVARDVFLDNVASVEAVLAQLRQLEAIARKRGYAVAIGHPHDATLAALEQWIPDAQARGIELVPLSSVIAARFPLADVPKYAQLHRETAAVEPAAGQRVR